MTVLFMADEDLDNDILRGLLRRKPDADVVRAQDVGLSNRKDPEILQWAATQTRVILTHDVSTMTKYAWERVDKGLPMPGVIAINQFLPLGKVIDDLVLIAECSLEGDWDGKVQYLPL